MKHFYKKIQLSFIFVIVLIISIQGQTRTENYILTRELLESTTDTTRNNISTKQHISKINYVDGLGRTKLTIINPVSNSVIPGQIVNPSLASKVTYDGYGRIKEEYLPGIVSGMDYTTSIDYSNYSDSNVFSRKLYEDSPLNRVIKQGAPGAAWDITSSGAIKFDYQANTSSDGVIFYDAKTTFSPSLNIYDIELKQRENQPYYTDGMLYKTITTDENNQPIIEFKNKDGQILLKRIDINTGRHDTYYVYDIYGNLTYVIPPKLANLYANSLPSDWQDLMNNLGYQYKYDNKNRLVEKKLPGKGWEYMLYDNQNRLVGVQDENMRRENYWIFTKYDQFGRVAITGKTWESPSRTRGDIQSGINMYLGRNNVYRDTVGYIQDNLQIFYNEAGYGYNNHILTVNYYDDYPLLKDDVITSGNVLNENQTIAPSNLLKGLPTLNIIRSLDTWENNQWNFEYNYTFYDNKYLRPIKNHKINYLGGSTIVESELDFRGKLKQAVTTHKRLKENIPLKISEVFSYDNFERVVKHTHQLNNGKIEVLAQNIYNEIGQLTSKKVGNTIESPYQTIDYKYNVRGWLTQINDITNLGTDLFAFKINYNTKDQTNASANTKELFNGNISQTLWTSQENSYIRSYDYLYDGLNRLTDANYSNISTSITGAYDEKISYDANGNIMSLKRYGQTERANPIFIDDLSYAYENAEKSNRLLKVTDTRSSFGFDDKNKGDDYTYDDNGNLIEDKNKGITEIKYNYLNLPTEIIWNNTKKIKYYYDATGVKLRKIVTDGSKITTIDYLDGFQYKENVLLFFPTAEGYLNAITDQNNVIYNYVYNITDHLGNVRVSYAWDEVNNTLKTVSEEHYYPFGLKHNGYSKPPRNIIGDNGLINIEIGTPNDLAVYGSANYKYKYNGKELQDELGLNMYAMDMRQYDPAIARWVVQDPVVHHNMSPYNAFDNNPVYWADPSGADVVETEDSWNFSGEDAKSLFLLLANGGDDDKKKNRESERRRERRRDRNRSRIGSGSVLFDARGQELLSHWLNGSGKDLNLSGENWGDYMKDNDLLSSQIQGKLRDFLISMREKIKSGGIHNVNITFHGEIENGYSTGYEMLHGSHSGLGDTQIKGTVHYNSKTKQFDFNVNLIWNDKIDANRKYSDDIILSNFLNIFYTPKDYNVKIKWNDKISIK